MSGQEKSMETMQSKRRQKLRNYLVGAAIFAFAAFVYALTWIKIANKTF